MQKILITKISLILSSVVFGQTSINSSGGNVSNSSGEVSYSIGQFAYNNTSNSAGSVTQGIQNAIEISILSIVENSLNLTLKAFPNPTHESLNLLIENYKNEKISYKLIDLDGRLRSEMEIFFNNTIIEMKQFPVGTYIVEIYKENQKNQVFKIIKTQ